MFATCPVKVAGNSPTIVLGSGRLVVRLRTCWEKDDKRRGRTIAARDDLAKRGGLSFHRCFQRGGFIRAGTSREFQP